MTRVLAVLVATLVLAAPPAAYAAAHATEPVAARAGTAADHTWLGPRLHRWSTCRSIRYRVNAAGTTPKWRAEVRRAIHRVENASGLRFRYDGTTAFVPDGRHRDPHGTDLVVAFTSGSKLGDPTAIAEGGAFPQTVRHHRVLRSGFVVIGSSLFGALAPGFGRGPRYGVQGTQGQVLMHELGHAVGLGHAQQRAEIMYPTLTRKKARWGAGDLAGLRTLGAGPCVRGGR